jgi:hypothetical protein
MVVSMFSSAKVVSLVWVYGMGREFVQHFSQVPVKQNHPVA